MLNEMKSAFGGNIKKILVSTAAGVLMLGATLAPAFAATTTVYPGNLQGWYSADTRTGGQINFVSDSTSPFPSGALQLLTDNTNTAKAQYLKDVNTPLSNVTNLSYYTKYVAGPAVADAQFQVVVYLNGANGGYTTLVYEPYWNGTVDTTGAWQNWDVNASDAKLWSSKTVSIESCSVVSGAGGPPFYTLNQIRAMCPNAIVLSVGVNVGSYNPSYNVETDGVVFNDTTYDFEASAPLVSPTSKDQCKDNGWKTFNNPTFKNQGQCVSYTNHN